MTVEEKRNVKRDIIQKKVLDNWKENNYIGTYQVSMGLGKGRIIAEAIKMIINNPVTFKMIDSKKIPILIQVSSTFLRDVDTVNELLYWGIDKDFLANKVTFVCYHTSYKWKKKDIGLMISDKL